MLAEMIENMYTTDIFADEDMRGDLDWNTLLGKVVENALAILWVDNGPVTPQCASIWSSYKRALWG